MDNLLFLADTGRKTVDQGVTAMFKGIGSAMNQIKLGIYDIMPEMMAFMGEVWVILIPIGFAIVTWVFNFVMRIFGSFRR